MDGGSSSVASDNGCCAAASGEIPGVSALAIPGAMLFALILAACGEPPAQTLLQYSSAPAVKVSPVYRLAPHPLYSPQRLGKIFQPLIDHLNHNLPGAQVELEGSRDYQACEQKFRARGPAFLMPNPWQTIEAMKAGYHVVAMWGDAEDFKGVFIVRRDSGIKSPDDLRGKAVSYPSPTALAAAIMPQYYLHNRGIDINRDIQNLYVGSQESSIMTVYMGTSAAGATWPPPWRLFQKAHPTEAAQLKVIWETSPLINNSVMAHNDVPEAIREAVRQTLLDLSQTPEGKRILAGMETSRFHVANDASYDVVRQYIARFEQSVRPVEEK